MSSVDCTSVDSRQGQKNVVRLKNRCIHTRGGWTWSRVLNSPQYKRPIHSKNNGLNKWRCTKMKQKIDIAPYPSHPPFKTQEKKWKYVHHFDHNSVNFHIMMKEGNSSLNHSDFLAKRSETLSPTAQVKKTTTTTTTKRCALPCHCWLCSGH